MENNKESETSQKVDYPIGDVERIRLTSKSYSIKNQITPKFFSKSLILSLLIIIIFYFSMLILYPFINQFKAMMVREMSEQNGNLGLNQNYSRVKPNDKNFIYIPIVGTDDIHGNFFPKVNNIKVNGEELTYKTGGLEFVAKYINILREEFGANRVLYFDGGDFYQGGLASILFDGEIMQDFFNIIGLNASTIGNHEFDYARDWIESKIKRAKYKTLVNNIVDNTTNRKRGALGKNHERSHIYTIKLDNNDEIKIGVIGLTFNMKNDKKMPNTWGNRATWDNIQFFSYITELEQESQRLRKLGCSYSPNSFRISL